jgi:hypothetical protein
MLKITGKGLGKARNRIGHVAPSIVVLLVAAFGYGQQSSRDEKASQIIPARLTASAPASAFAKYAASLQERNPFIEAGPVRVEIEASLPGLGKQGSMLAVRETGDSERSEYHVITLDGDSTVTHQVIARYLSAQEHAEGLPYSSVAVTPANYTFRYIGSVETDGSIAYVFQVTPREKREGLFRGQIWIDSVTGTAIHQEGRFVKRPIFVRRIEVARDTQLSNGLPFSRVTHVAIETRVGRAELKITECPFAMMDSEAAGQLVARVGAR